MIFSRLKKCLLSIELVYLDYLFFRDDTIEIIRLQEEARELTRRKAAEERQADDGKIVFII
jgi:hypothetical protein